MLRINLRVRTLNDNWYVCLLSSLWSRSQSNSQSAAALCRNFVLIGPGLTQVESMETTINVVAMDVNHCQVETDLISNIRYVALPWTLEQETSCPFHGQISIFNTEVLD